jgi:hypothetical protein
MSSATDELAAARAARDAARAAYDASLLELRGDPAEQSIGGRVAERLSEDARAAFDKALDVASESKAIIAGTIAALVLWFLRHPIIAWAEHMLGDEEEESETDD